MTDNTENLALEHLRAIRGELADMKNRITHLEMQVSAMGQQLSGLTTAVYASNSQDLSMQQQRDRINRRLELQD
jgi:hypothetical protein